MCGEYYTAVKMNASEFYASTQINLKNILSEKANYIIHIFINKKNYTKYFLGMKLSRQYDTKL